MTTDERIENVERELAALKAQLAQCVRTRAVEVVDENGKTRANLGVLKDVAGADWYDDNGKGHAMRGLYKGEAGLDLYDENGTICTTLGQSRLDLYDNRGEVRLSLFQSDVKGGVYLSDVLGTICAALSTDDNGPALALNDAPGKPSVLLGVDANAGNAIQHMPAGEARLVLCDAAGKRRALLTVDADGPAVSLSDAAGRTVWSAP